MSATCSFLGGFSGYGVETVLPFMGFKKMYLIRLKSRRKRKKKKTAMWGGRGVGQASLRGGFLTILLKNVMRHYRPALLFHGLANYISHGWMSMKWKRFDLSFLLFFKQHDRPSVKRLEALQNVSLSLYYFSFSPQTLSSVFFRLIHYVLPLDADATPGSKSIKTAIYSTNIEALQ